MEKAKVLLIILDGWGIAENPEVSAIDIAKLSYYTHLLKTYPNAKLQASEKYVGLPDGQMGNSEVGHMNLGAGRVVNQDIVRINKALAEGTFGQNQTFVDCIDYCKSNNKTLHLCGLLSDGGIHSHINHLMGILDILSDKQLNKINIHCFMDGRDTDPKSGISYIEQLEQHIQACGLADVASIASLCGRYYAMDRDNRWDRVKRAYDMLIAGKGELHKSATQAMQAAYASGLTDEFIEPLIIADRAEDYSPIKDGDAVLMFNFRTDRCREISKVLSQIDMPEQNMAKLNLHYCTLTNYDEQFTGVHILFNKDKLKNTLGEVLANNSKRQLRIAETEKYAHVTFFFNGGREQPFENEDRILCPSPKVATYDLQPEMSAAEVTENLLPILQRADVDFICLNYANPDMVGHTGVLSAAIQACQMVDRCLSQVVETALESDYHVLILADHGNTDKMLNIDGTPHTAHTMAKVPLIYAHTAHKNARVRDGKLADIAPTILKLIGLDIPAEMTGTALIS